MTPPWQLLSAVLFFGIQSGSQFRNAESWAVELTQIKRQGEPIDIMLTFYNGEANDKLSSNFLNCVRSILLHSTSLLHLHIITDDFGRRFAEEHVRLEQHDYTELTVTYYDKEEIATKTNHQLGTRFYEHFRYSMRARYGGDLYFTSIVAHKIFPNISRLILLDVDLQFRSDISELYSMFDKFDDQQVIGLALEQQPVYLNAFAKYRDANPSTRLGSPPPDGFSGFNSGVLLANLHKMRRSLDYNALLDGRTVDALARKYHFKGHLGDQDFYTLAAAEKPQLFLQIPCGWNVQLCEWWRRVYGSDVFEKYHRCDMDVKVYHGNCNSPIPSS
uniref:Xyloside xylosyltransferase 1 n=1 Tax=Trichuris muris TaxID=70415 RepID=A0A5S6Q5N6_TRIMR